MDKLEYETEKEKIEKINRILYYLDYCYSEAYSYLIDAKSDLKKINELSNELKVTTESKAINQELKETREWLERLEESITDLNGLSEGVNKYYKKAIKT